MEKERPECWILKTSCKIRDYFYLIRYFYLWLSAHGRTFTDFLIEYLLSPEIPHASEIFLKMVSLSSLFHHEPASIVTFVSTKASGYIGVDAPIIIISRACAHIFKRSSTEPLIIVVPLSTTIKPFIQVFDFLAMC